MLVLKRLENLRFGALKTFFARTMADENSLGSLKSNPHYQKYAEKIKQLQKSSPDEFLERMEALKSKPKKVKDAVKGREFSAISSPKETLDSTGARTTYKQKKLSDIMKMELIENKTADEVKHIWEDYHKTKEVIAAVIPVELYTKIYSRGKQYPVFLFPLPRGQGYEFIVSEISEHEVHFTPLISYQAYKENAPECLTLVHYAELQSKGIILMRGDYNKDILNGKESQCLANQLQMYYGQDNEKRLNLLERFTSRPDDFRHMDLIAELECLSL
ncbi:ATP synthase mitochondrial F1 complex assembly factor 1 [Schistocerca piceifrons]|uniref:ATP synthase mitochondrial F1 complex assembly factor 1 n=1 Tax=Schistocerca piceifrons TaxID=274613 RepID=UPI001F5FDF5B|nr:ATP synthase mitochondrial F1 complex assembly factor 1 [Schistocerca piceifrons]